MYVGLRTAALVLRYYFFFDDTASTEIYTLSLHDALPIFSETKIFGRYSKEIIRKHMHRCLVPLRFSGLPQNLKGTDRKSTRLNSSHSQISYAVFCLKKKRRSWMSWPHATMCRSHLILITL